ncbi:MAG: hypothetical protein NTY19_07700 [Planctomycetota bacterium]|nr:hypothetical protein [Planctomycetota bacterium]
MTEVVLGRSQAFLGSDQSYRASVRPNGRALVYDDRQDEALAREGAALSHSTVWRWLSWLGDGLQRTFREARRLIRRREPRSPLHRQDWSVSSAKYRSESRRERRRWRGMSYGNRENPRWRSLFYQLALKPFYGGRRIVIIDDAGSLDPFGASYLLRTLEEPPSRSLIILVASEQMQWPKIRSRCQIVRFHALQPETVAQLLLTQGVAKTTATASHLAALSEGSVRRAIELADKRVGEFRQTLLAELSQPDWNSVEFSKTLGQFVEEASKEAPPRLARMIQLMGFAIEFYRQLLRSLSGASVTGDDVLRRAVAAAHRSWRGGTETVACCLDRCVDAMGHVQANANQATLLDCWLDDLAGMTRSGRPLLE